MCGRLGEKMVHINKFSKPDRLLPKYTERGGRGGRGKGWERDRERNKNWDLSSLLFFETMFLPLQD